MMEPLVLIPGMMCDARIFSYQINVLSRERPVMVLPVSHGETIRDMVGAVAGQLPERFALAGLSMGGIVAMELLRRCPDQVSRLCLMATSPLAETPAEAAAREPMIAKVRAGYLNEALQEAVRPDFLAPSARRMELIQTVWAMGEELGPDLFIRQSRALQRRNDQQGTLRRSKVPTLVLCGDLDPLTPVRRHEFMAELMPNARLHIMENCGHLPVIEQPEELTGVLQNWLAEPLPEVVPA